MPDIVALGAGALLGIMLLFTDSHTDWTPSFLVVVGILAFVLVGALIAGQLERRGPS